LKIHSLVLGSGAAVFVFIMWYLGIGYNMIADLSKNSLWLTFPVLILLGSVFFIITFLILSAFIWIALLFLALILCLFPFILLKIFRVKNHFGGLVKACFYSFAPFIAIFITLAHLNLVKYNYSSFAMLRVEENLLYYFTVLFFWGVFSIGIRRETKIKRWQAVALAVFSVVILVFANLIFDLKLLPRIEHLI
jgi:hypothetical protein